MIEPEDLRFIEFYGNPDWIDFHGVRVYADPMVPPGEIRIVTPEGPVHIIRNVRCPDCEGTGATPDGKICCAALPTPPHKENRMKGFIEVRTLSSHELRLIAVPTITRVQARYTDGTAEIRLSNGDVLICEESYDQVKLLLEASGD